MAPPKELGERLLYRVDGDGRPIEKYEEFTDPTVALDIAELEDTDKWQRVRTGR